jgi:hypothetical protein
MPKCVKCGADTSLHINGIPVCLKCVQGQETERPKEAGPKLNRSKAPEQHNPQH